MAEGFIDELAMITRRKRFQKGVAHVEVVQVTRGLIRARRLRGCAHVRACEKISQGRVVLPETEDRSDASPVG